MSYSQRLLYETLRTLDTNTINIGTTFIALGVPLAHPCSLIKMVNLSNKNLLISIDGTNAIDICPSESFWLYDITTNSPQTNHIFVDQGRQYYVKTSDAALGTGNVYLVVQYIQNNLKTTHTP